MARTRFNMDTVVEVADVAVAQALLAKQKDAQFHHTLLLKRVIEVGKATCKELAVWLEAEKATLMDEAHRAPWDKYSDACHLRYFINRCRGAVKATLPDGTAVVQTATKVRKAKADVKVEAAATEAEVEEVVTENEAALEEAGL